MKSRITKKCLAAILSISLLLQIGLQLVYGEDMVTDKTRETETGETKTITGFADLSEELKDIILPIDTLEEELSLPEILRAIVQYTLYKEEAGQELENKVEENLDLEVSWTSDKEFYSREEGEFTYTAKVKDENFTLAEGVEMPSIIVRIEDSSELLNEIVDTMNTDNMAYARRGTTPADKSYNVSKGDITIEKGTTDGTLKVTHSNGTVQDNITKETMITLTGTTTNNIVKVNDGVEAKISLSGVDIKAPDGKSAFEISGDGSRVNITLVGENNSLKSGDRSAGLQMEGKSDLIINGTGKLIATGGTRASGIGGGNEGFLSGSVTITDGEVTAKGGDYGSGIGGGNKGSINKEGKVEIIGGTVIATGGDYGSGIGGGYEGSLSGLVEIADGSVTVTGGHQGSGIGGGNEGSMNQSGKVKITGGSVIATGGGQGAGIGGGYKGSLSGLVEIGGDSKVEATGGDYGSGIGGGGNKGSLNGSITITDGTVTATGGKYGSGIGAGNEGEINQDGKIEIRGGVVTSTGGQYGSGIGAGFKGSIIGKIEITGGNITAIGGSQGAGIGGGSESSIDPAGIVKITGGSVNTTGGAHGAGIGGGNKGSLTGTINIEADTVDVTDTQVSIKEGITKTSIYGEEIYKPSDDSIVSNGVVSYYQIDGTSIESPKQVGTYKVKTTSGNRTVTRKFKIEAKIMTIESIAIKTPATKLVYKVGESLDITGLVIEGTYSDNSNKEETITVTNITGFDSSLVVASQELTVTVGEKTTSYTIEIQAEPVVRYIVTFKDYDGEEFKAEEVEEGKSAIAPLDPIRSGYTFIGWDRSFDNIIADTIVTAEYSKDSSGDDTDSGGSSGGISSLGRPSDDNSKDKDTTKVESTKETGGPTKAIASTSSKVTKDTANVQVNKNTVKEAVEKAQTAAKKNGTEEDGISVEIKVDTKNIKASNLSASIGQSTIEDLTKAGVKNLSINSDVALISLDLETLKTIQEEIKTDINFSAKKVETNTLSGEVKEMVGERPVYDFSITGSNGEKLSKFGKGKISISLPYTLGAGEKAENLVIYYINDQGEIEEMPNFIYDKESEIISFETDHFSKFGVGYKEDQVSPTFTDIEKHWAKDNIESVTARGLFIGTGQDKFSPDISMTRGMFVTVLGRLAGVDVSEYKASSFTDVKTDAYYMPYTEWASEVGIVKGIGENKFAPETNINSEQMAVLMANYAKLIDLELEEVNSENTFEDHAEISKYAKKPVKDMQTSGIISGKAGNVFDPKGKATRAEVSSVLKRFIDILEK